MAETKMNPEIKARWVAALRSGEYKQGRGRLRSDQGHCCLGVLCELHAKQAGAEWEGSRYMGAVVILPDEVASWAGLGNFGKEFVEIEGVRDILPNHNDGPGDLDLVTTPRRTFAEIADAIEAQL